MNNELCDFCTFKETTHSISPGEQTFSCVSLRKCVNQLITNLKPATIKDGDIIINDLPEEMFVSTHKETLTEILHCLLNTIAVNGHRHIIHISAKMIGNITLMHFRNNHSEYNDEIADSLQKTEPLAERLGGCVTISNNKMYGLNLTFTFINH